MFEIVHQQGLKVYLHIMYNGMFSRNLYVQHPVTKDLPVSPRFSLAIVYPDANSVLLHLYTAVLISSMRRTLCSKLFTSRA